MARRKLEFHPEALEEAENAAEWYATRSQRAALRFAVTLEQALTRLLEDPEQWPKYLHGTRQILLRRFPYLVVYLTQPGVVKVIAVAHARRKPGYWRFRILR
jgi:toxin ParE1/3/4